MGKHVLVLRCGVFFQESKTDRSYLCKHVLSPRGNYQWVFKSSCILLVLSWVQPCIKPILSRRN